MTVRFRTWLLGVVLVVLATIFVLGFLLLSDPDHLKAVILRQIEANLGRKIEVGDARLEFFPRPRLELSRVVIRDSDPSRVFMKARRFDVILRSTPLLQMQVMVKRMSIEQPEVMLRRDQAGRWNFLASASGARTEETSLGNPLHLLLMMEETALTDGTVTIVDEFRPDGLRTLELNSLDLAIATQLQGMLMDLRLSGKVPAGLGSSSVTLTGTVTRATAPTNLPETGPAPPIPPLQFQGTLDVLHVDLRQMMDFFGSRPIPDRIHGTANLRSRIRLVPGMSGHDMVLSEMQANVESLTISGQASLSGIITRQPTFALTVSATPVSLDELLSRFPVEWLPPQLQTILTEREIKGTVEVVTATVTGSTIPAPHASVTGEFRIRQGQALLGSNRTRAQNLSGTVFLEPDRLRVTDVTGDYGTMQVTDGKVAVVFLEQGPSLEMDVSGTMAAADLIGTLAKSIQAPPLAKALADMRDVKGQAAVSFRITGLLNQPDGLAFTGADISPQDASFRSPALPEPVVGLNGRVLYSKAGVEFDRVRGQLGQIPFQVHGTITTDTPAQFQGFTVWARTDASQALRFLSNGVPGQTAVQGLKGMIGIALALAGPTATPQIKGVLEFNQATLTFPQILEKPAGQPAVLEFDSTLSRDKVLSIQRMDLIIPPARLAGKGTIWLGRQFRVNSSLISGPIPLAGLPSGMTIGGIDAGTLEVSLDIKGKGKDWKAWSVTGWVALTDGLIVSKKFHAPLTDIYVRAQLVRNAVDLKRLEFQIKDSFVRVVGVVRNWHKKPSANLTVHSPQLDLELLIPKGERSPVRNFLEDLAATGHLTASVEITRSQYKQVSVNDLSCRINIGDEVLDVNQITGQLEEGTIAGHLVVRLPKAKPAEAEVQMQLAGVPFENVLQVLDDQQRLVTGELTLAATVQGNGRNPHGILNTLNGHAEFQVAEGRILKGKIVPRILAILDIPNLLQGKIDLSTEGMPFDKLSGTLAIRNGIVTSENLVIDSPILKISSAGSYDMPTDQLDLVVVVSPFGSYTKLLQSIPLFGKLLAGERKGFTTAFFDVKGPLKDPQVERRPMKSIAAGLTGLAQLAADVLINTLKLPAEIIGTNDEKPRAPDTGGQAEQPAPAVP